MINELEKKIESLITKDKPEKEVEALKELIKCEKNIENEIQKCEKTEIKFQKYVLINKIWIKK